MDVWVVAAAAGAGYIAQHWKNLLRSRHDLSGSSPGHPSLVRTGSSPHLEHDQNCSSPLEIPRKKLGECATERLSFHEPEMASTSSLARGNVCDLDCCNLTSGLPSDFHDGRVCGNVIEPLYESPLPSCTRELAFSSGSARNKSSLRSRRKIGHLIKPLNSLESCLMAQLYREDGEVKEYLFSSNSSPWTPTARSFVVTDGSKIISRATTRGVGHHQDNFSLVNTASGVPQLPCVQCKELQKKANVEDHCERLDDSIKVNEKRQTRLQGSSHGVLLFCLGVSLGMVSSLWKNRKEMDKLNELLKQSENLVQDLHEELELKDSLTVKELSSENCEEAYNESSNNGALYAISPKEKLDESSANQDSKSQKTEEETFSKIEAELEAELERLELSMSSSKLNGKLTELVELDQDFVPDLAEGEFRAEFFRKNARGQPYADQDGSSTSTPHPVNYAVSPRELTLRLHEVLQSQLEERVKELEMALHNSERKFRFMEAELVSSWRESSNSEAGSSSTHGSPVLRAEQRAPDQPVVINLSGEALDAYNEAYDVFTRLEESEEEDINAVVSRVKDNNNQEKTLHPYEGNFNWIGNGHDECDDGHDEMEKLLIRNIVEKARKGSPAVLNVQRALFSLDDK